MLNWSNQEVISYSMIVKTIVFINKDRYWYKLTDDSFFIKYEKSKFSLYAFSSIKKFEMMIYLKENTWSV